MRRKVITNLRWVSLKHFYADCERYLRWSDTIGVPPSRENLAARITMGYHAIEKGLALEAPRYGFGVKNAICLLSNLGQYVRRFQADELVAISLQCLDAYLAFHRNNQEVKEKIGPAIRALCESSAGCRDKRAEGGITNRTRHEIWQAARRSMDDFFLKRHSIRHFSEKGATDEEVRHALRLAQMTPSVCNRQGWRVHIYRGAKAAEVMFYQNGNSGFGHQASHLFLVTGDLRYFVGIGERNQVWIDCGMYAMSLVYALHSLGLGTCCLNASNDLNVDEDLRRAAGIPEWEVSIMMIATGSLPEQFKVTRSPRLSLDRVALWH